MRFESERRPPRERVASSPQTVVDEHDAGAAVTLRAGDDSATLDPPGRRSSERPDWNRAA
ncbi:amphi-Trp domain-containing protein [Haloplanus litoreus]|uniref:Amphi-Trp domain-containing protein n=1 Tax=Haloplanus litoreus TaxID=767515 RepID=A0ABD6A155_9EURY